MFTKKKIDVKKLGERIRTLREATGLSQNDLAASGKIDVSTLSRLEAGKASAPAKGEEEPPANPSIKVLNSIAEALDCATVDLFDKPKSEAKTQQELMLKDMFERAKHLYPDELNPVYALIVKLTEGRYTKLLGFIKKPVPPLKEK